MAMNRYRLHEPRIKRPPHPTVAPNQQWKRNDLPQDYFKKIENFKYPNYIDINGECQDIEGHKNKPCWSVKCAFSDSLHLSEEEIFYLYRLVHE